MDSFGDELLFEERPVLRSVSSRVAQPESSLFEQNKFGPKPTVSSDLYRSVLFHDDPHKNLAWAQAPKPSGFVSLDADHLPAKFTKYFETALPTEQTTTATAPPMMLRTMSNTAFVWQGRQITLPVLKDTGLDFTFLCRSEPTELLDALQTVLTNLECDCKVMCKDDEPQSLIEASTFIDFKLLTVRVNVFVKNETEGLLLVEVRRWQGDALKFCRFYEKVFSSLLESYPGLVDDASVKKFDCSSSPPSKPPPELCCTRMSRGLFDSLMDSCRLKFLERQCEGLASLASVTSQPGNRDVLPKFAHELLELVADFLPSNDLSIQHSCAALVAHVLSATRCDTKTLFVNAHLAAGSHSRAAPSEPRPVNVQSSASASVSASAAAHATSPGHSLANSSRKCAKAAVATPRLPHEHSCHSLEARSFFSKLCPLLHASSSHVRSLAEEVISRVAQQCPEPKLIEEVLQMATQPASKCDSEQRESQTQSGPFLPQQFVVQLPASANLPCSSSACESCS